MPVKQYLEESSAQMERVPWNFDGKSVVEFGCGLGGNLLSKANIFRQGVGLDVNRGYLRIARKLARQRNIINVSFVELDGEELPWRLTFDLAFSIGVFERLSEDVVSRCVLQLRSAIRDNGRLVLYFLRDRAKGSQFGRRLGDESYVFWTDAALQELFSRSALQVEAFLRWNAYSDLYVLRKST